MVAWAVVLWQPRTAAGGMGTAMAAPVFLAGWVAMMAAMMFPSAAPMILTFAMVHAGRRAGGGSVVPTWIFLVGYVVVWVGFGLVANLAAAGIDTLAMRHRWSIDVAGRLTGLLIAMAGVYQLTPLKRACLGRCRSPLAFIASSWRDGRTGAFRMGLEHGMTCLGCCWALFLLLFPIGVMNIAAMVTLTLVVFAEKTLRWGPRMAQVAAPALVALGAALLVWPRALPISL